MMSIVNEARDQGGLEDTVILPFPSFSDMYLEPLDDFSSTLSEGVAGETVHLDQPALILHSSGRFFFPRSL
jgi:hypothetical protein